MLSSHYHILLKTEPEGGYTVIVPSLPGCVSYGRTLREAKKMGADAISAYIPSLRKPHEPIPTDAETFFATLDLQYAKTT